jgi:polysaccharide biosynthesis protein PslH
VEAMIWKRHATVSTSIVKRRYMHEQWRRMVAFEGQACRRFDHVVAVSPQDADIMRRDYGVSEVSDVPTGVDIDYFTPTGRTPRNPFEIVFTGSMDWMPNDDAMTWFIADILPRVHAELPQATVTIVGRTPGERLVSLAAAARNVTVTGRVPDVRLYLERASVFVVPMRIGGGTRLKIFEAMAMGLPVVSTAVGAEGLPVVDGVDAVIRDDPSSFAAAIVTMLGHGPDRDRIGLTGQQVVRERYGWEGVADAFMDACEKVASREFSPR